MTSSIQSDVDQTVDSLDLSVLDGKEVDELQQIARDLNLDATTRRKQDLVFRIMEYHTEQSGLLLRQGVLEILPDGWGFLRGKN
ncbi:MAG: Rho termination factor N-terminal domain-containing protein, partial [Armatimonadota bacterium]